MHSVHDVHVPGSAYTKYHFYYAVDNERWIGAMDCRQSSCFFFLDTSTTMEYDANGRQKGRFGGIYYFI